MKRLLWLEWMKVRKYRAFWAFVVLFLVTEAAFTAFLYSAQSNFRAGAAKHIHIDLFRAGDIWSTTAWTASIAVLLLGLLLIMLISNEETYRTRRQHVIDGLSRMQVIAAKWWIALVSLLFAWLSFVVITVIFSALHGNSMADLGEGSLYAVWFLVKAAVTLAVAFMFGLWIRRSGLAIALYLAYFLLLEGIIGHFLNRIISGAGHLLPLEAGGSLVSNPFSRLLGAGSGTLPPALLAGTCIAYVILFVILSLLYIRRADL